MGLRVQAVQTPPTQEKTKVKPSRHSAHHYRRWCRHLRNDCKLDPRRRGYARYNWDLYWDGVRDVRLCDAAIWLIIEFDS